MAEAKVTISKITGNGTSYVRIEIEDALSGTTFVSVDLSMEAFGQAVTGLSMVSGDMKIRGLDLVGKRREMKRETVPTSKRNLSHEQALELAKPFEVDGWKPVLHEGSRNDTATDKAGNTTFSIPFVRWVDNA